MQAQRESLPQSAAGDTDRSCRETSCIWSQHPVGRSLADGLAQIVACGMLVYFPHCPQNVQWKTEGLLLVGTSVNTTEAASKLRKILYSAVQTQDFCKFAMIFSSQAKCQSFRLRGRFFRTIVVGDTMCTSMDSRSILETMLFFREANTFPLFLCLFLNT